MELIYIDESGDTIPLINGGKKYLVLTGCIFGEEDIPVIDEQFRSIKRKYYKDEHIEIKSNFLRYANPELTETSPLKLNSKEKYDELEKDLAEFLIKLPIKLVSIVIDKQEYWKKYPSQNPYMIAYIYLLERIQKILEKEKKLGICIIDPREGQVEKHFLGNELSKIHEKMRRTDGVIWKQCTRVIEKLLFSQSDSTNGIQIVDLYCYPVFHIFEYNKNKEEYWRFNELTFPKLDRSNEGKIIGYGLKFFPDNKKKDLKFFA